MKNCEFFLVTQPHLRGAVENGRIFTDTEELEDYLTVNNYDGYKVYRCTGTPQTLGEWQNG